MIKLKTRVNDRRRCKPDVGGEGLARGFCRDLRRKAQSCLVLMYAVLPCANLEREMPR